MSKIRLSHRAAAASASVLVLVLGGTTLASAEEDKDGKGRKEQGSRGQSSGRSQAQGGQQPSSQPAQARDGQQNRPSPTPSSTNRPTSPPPSHAQGTPPSPRPGNGGSGGGGGQGGNTQNPGEPNGGQGDNGDPNGNNGTFKVDGQPFDTNTSNEPHIECGPFRLVFFGFDDDQRGDITIAGQAPSGTAVVSQRNDVLISDDAAGGGPNDLDAIVTYEISDLDLSQLTAHPQQGYHLKVTLTTTEGPKHKVFWLEPCAVTPTEAPEETINPTTPPVVVPTTPPATVGGVKIVKPEQKTETRTGTKVLGTKFLRDATQPQVLGAGLTRGGSLAFTGSFTEMLLALGGTLLGLGGAFLLWSRRPRHGKHAA